MPSTSSSSIPTIVRSSLTYDNFSSISVTKSDNRFNHLIILRYLSLKL
ncbi:MAG: hypothetical protein IM537_08895 [Pseudanabaena sp. M57BS1SP1A06MG]|nr:hypothetical protein [Pseudanabaena sp. M57BS1SP1A06MG]